MELIIVYDGKFYPLHNGHLELITAAEKHFLQTYQAVHKYICPVDIKYIHPSISFDTRPDQIVSFLSSNQTDSISQSDISQSNIRCLWFKGSWKARNDYIQSLHPNAKLVQIAGTDSKISRAFIIDDGSAKGSRQPDLTFCSDKPAICSSIIRFLEKYPNAPAFHPKWLLDTDIVLGSGAGGMVKLMLLGRKEVAVKIINLSHLGLKLFENECNITSIVSESGVSPKLYAVGIMGQIGYMVTELCYPYYQREQRTYKKRDLSPFRKYKMLLDQTEYSKHLQLCHPRPLLEKHWVNIFLP